ncbi:MAG: hypothetical protein ACREO1_02865 [Arenimonas sp.]
MSHPLYSLLKQLEDARIPFTLARSREDTVRLNLTVVGERIEVDVFDDGHMEVSRFTGNEAVEGGIELIPGIIANNVD